MSVALSELSIPEDFAERFGRIAGWHGDTHTEIGKSIEAAKGKPRIERSVWHPAAAQPDDLVEELRIHYDDGVMVIVPVELLRRPK